MSKTTVGAPVIEFANLAMTSFAQVPWFISLDAFSVELISVIWPIILKLATIPSVTVKCKAKSLTEPLRIQTHRNHQMVLVTLGRESPVNSENCRSFRHHQETLFFVNRLVLLKEEKTCCLCANHWGKPVQCPGEKLHKLHRFWSRPSRQSYNLLFSPVVVELLVLLLLLLLPLLFHGCSLGRSCQSNTHTYWDLLSIL